MPSLGVPIAFFGESVFPISLPSLVTKQTFLLLVGLSGNHGRTCPWCCCLLGHVSFGRCLGSRYRWVGLLGLVIVRLIHYFTEDPKVLITKSPCTKIVPFSYSVNVRGLAFGWSRRTLIIWPFTWPRT